MTDPPVRPVRHDRLALCDIVSRANRGKGQEGPDGNQETSGRQHRTQEGGGEFEVGREVGTPAGMTQRATIGIAGQIRLPEPGTYEIVVSIEGDEKLVTFEAHPGPSRALA